VGAGVLLGQCILCWYCSSIIPLVMKYKLNFDDFSEAAYSTNILFTWKGLTWQVRLVAGTMIATTVLELALLLCFCNKTFSFMHVVSEHEELAECGRCFLVQRVHTHTVAKSSVLMTSFTHHSTLCKKLISFTISYFNFKLVLLKYMEKNFC
jgi:hypothetical protein